MSKLYSTSQYAKFLSFIVLVAGFVSSAAGDMAATEMMPLTKVIPYWHQVIKKQPNNAEAKAAYEWATFARDVMGVDEVQIMLGGGEKSVVEQNIVWAIERVITSKPWTQVTNKITKAKIAKWRTKLESKFGKKSFQWAWVLFQLEEKENLKQTLQQAYATEFDNVMKMTEVVIGFDDDPPLFLVQAIRTNLDPLSSDAEKKSMDEKMKKMKVHVANLPESHVVT